MTKMIFEFSLKLWRISALNRGKDTHNNVNNRVEHGHLGDVISLEKGLLDVNADNAKRPRHHISERNLKYLSVKFESLFSREAFKV